MKCSKFPTPPGLIIAAIMPKVDCVAVFSDLRLTNVNKHLQEIRKVEEATRQETGCLIFRANRRVDGDENVVTFIGHFASEKDLDDHFQVRKVLETFGPKRTFFSSFPFWRRRRT